MKFDAGILKDDEKVIFELRELYHKYGYSQYKMSKFEEYDLYAQNKDFLIADSVITFTDTNGKLMALKPDVTLSIVRNSRDGGGSVQKVYYHENVYRVSKSTGATKEIPQVGIECLGAVGDYDIFETLLLAMQSLRCISDTCKLDISHLDILSEMIGRLQLPESVTERLLKCVEQKNPHELEKICAESGAERKAVESLKRLLLTDGAPSEVLPVLEQLQCSTKAVAQLRSAVAILEANGFRDCINIDFSLVSDRNYYNGIAFKGFVSGIPTSVLSGGQYDNLMKRMGRTSRAIGFAVYLDQLERLSDDQVGDDADVLLLYDESADPAALCRAVQQWISLGLQVSAQKAIPEKFRYKQLVRFSGSEVEKLENNT